MIWVAKQFARTIQFAINSIGMFMFKSFWSKMKWLWHHSIWSVFMNNHLWIDDWCNDRTFIALVLCCLTIFTSISFNLFQMSFDEEFVVTDDSKLRISSYSSMINWYLLILWFRWHSSICFIIAFLTPYLCSSCVVDDFESDNSMNKEDYLLKISSMRW